jgi:hypothetical protein
MNKTFKQSLRVLTLVLVALILAGTVQAWPPPGVDFCAWARDEAYGCWRQYENCGGMDVDGCYDQLEQCLADSGIWYCE